MVKPAAYVPARCEPRDDVRHKLAVRAVVVVRRINDLLHRRPDLIRELRGFNRDPNVVAETRHPVSRADYKIFRYGGVKYAARPELLLHTFCSVKYAAFILRRNVLPPEKRIRVMTKLLLQGLVYSSEQSNQLPILRRRHRFRLNG